MTYVGKVGELVLPRTFFSRYKMQQTRSSEREDAGFGLSSRPGSQRSIQVILITTTSCKCPQVTYPEEKAETLDNYRLALQPLKALMAFCKAAGSFTFYP
jgi:hypothetical protein